jgi:hypothetical protein
MRARVAASALVVLVLAASGSCGGGSTPSAQQLGGPAAADLERSWEVTLDVVEVIPSGIVVAEPHRERAYRFERGDCPTEVEISAAEGDPAPIAAEDITVETDLLRWVGSATVEVAGGTVSGLPFAQVDETTFAMSYEARVRCLDADGAPVGELVQVHELEWELEARGAPELLTGELVRGIRTDPGCAPPAGQESGTVEELRATPAPTD